MATSQFRGVISPILTPFQSDGEIATELYVSHARASLDAGIHFLSPFGTTGEAAAVGTAERMRTLEALVAAGVPADRLMPGTGLCALPDTVDLTRHATELGCAATMVLPPFYYPTSEDGLFDYYARLIDSVDSEKLRICLYHIPQMSGVAVSADLTARLNTAFPETVVAYKDSSGDWENTKAVIDAAPNVSVFPASETHLVQGLEQGAAGCISATCNSNASVIAAYFNAHLAGDTKVCDALRHEMIAHRKAVQDAGFIPALKSMFSDATGNSTWLNVRPPMPSIDAKLGQRLNRELAWQYMAGIPRQSVSS